MLVDALAVKVILHAWELDPFVQGLVADSQHRVMGHPKTKGSVAIMAFGRKEFCR